MSVTRQPDRAIGLPPVFSVTAIVTIVALGALLLLYPQPDGRGTFPSWVQIVAWAGVLLMTALLGAILSISFRAVRRGALEVQATL